MRPVNDNQDAGRVEFSIQKELGTAIRASMAAVTCEPLSKEMAILLLQLALYEALKDLAKEGPAAYPERG